MDESDLLDKESAFAAIIASQEESRKLALQAGAALNALRESIVAMQRGMQIPFSLVSAEMLGIRGAIDKALAPINGLDGLSEIVAKAYAVAEEKIATNSLWFVKTNWYLSGRIFDEWKFHDIYSTQDIEEGEKLIIAMFYKIKEKIKDSICEEFPKRKNIIEEMFQCFENQLYHAVITLAYSQIDGMCEERTGAQFWGYDKKNSAPKVNAILNMTENVPDFSLINPQLRNRLLSNENFTSETDKDMSSYNRHAVLHGYSYLYGNRKNAVRAILYMDYLIYVLQTAYRFQ